MTLPDPFRLRVLKALTATLQSITPDNDYRYDLSDAVFRGRTWFGEDDPLPMVSILEPPQTIDQALSHGPNSNRHGEWDILIQGWDQEDAAAPLDKLYVMAAEVSMTLAKEKARIRAGTRTSDIFGMGAGFDDAYNGIMDIEIGAAVVRPPDEVSTRSCFYLILTFKLAEDMARPFG